MRKAQSIIEFLAMMGFVTIFLLILLIVAFAIFSKSQTDKFSYKLNTYADTLQKEMILASEMHNGYYTILNIPDNIEGKTFSIDNTDKYIIISSGSTRIERQIPFLQGKLIQGKNKISKKDGVVAVT